MITVSIFINGNPIITRSATNISEGEQKGNQEYKVDDGSIIKHNYEDGAIPLAIEMLKGVKEI